MPDGMTKDEYTAQGMLLGYKYEPSMNAYYNDEIAWLDADTLATLDDDEWLRRYEDAFGKHTHTDTQRA